MLNKEELVKKLAEKNDIPMVRAKEMLNSVVDVLKTAVLEDDGFDLYKFMKVEVVYKEESVGRNPLTGEKIIVPAKRIPKARFSSVVKTGLNPNL